MRDSAAERQPIVWLKQSTYSQELIKVSGIVLFLEAAEEDTDSVLMINMCLGSTSPAVSLKHQSSVSIRQKGRDWSHGRCAGPQADLPWFWRSQLTNALRSRDFIPYPLPPIDYMESQ